MSHRLVRYTLTWTPRVKGRPRTTYNTGNPRTYTDRGTVAAEKALAEQWDSEPFDGPISVILELHDDHVVVEIETAEEPTSRKLRGDIDNYMKLVLDALNGHAWVDDKQITTLKVSKR
jgi:crossover junction endodeoxyribonuclease RusA